MRFEIIAVGKIKDKWLRQGIDEFAKRIGAYATLSLVEVPDLPGSKATVLVGEGEQILGRVNPRTYLIALAIKGKTMGSPELAALLRRLAVGGHSHFTFVIGGSQGLSGQVLDRADLILSFSAFTFPHQLMRLILLEQIYRACTIIAGHPYHK